jgi:hypothetical protein
LEPQFGDRIRLGVLTEEITPEVVDEVWELTGRAERRRRLLPARAVVSFVLALCLFSSSDSAGAPGYWAVLRIPTEKLRHLSGGSVQRLPTSSVSPEPASAWETSRSRRCSNAGAGAMLGPRCLQGLDDVLEGRDGGGGEAVRGAVPGGLDDQVGQRMVLRGPVHPGLQDGE